ncbi:hemerythrin domain-containing protein [Nocardiopsis trehalosi]|uniref:hemerythrin domain-containing protein n=1 Tax=Nocardiopsis trehalosi TaxID=109329 RepID=UPI000AB72134|nr:hemerythrin domain-containing protein [Nocardiopsis trehalosi]
MARDVITLITRDHRELEEMVDRLAKEPEGRERLVGEVAARFAAHGAAEEEHVYPVVVRAAAGVAGDRAGAGAVVPEAEGGGADVVRGAREHRVAGEVLGRLCACDPSSPGFDDLLHEFVDVVVRHVREEETRVLPALRAVVDPAGLERLGEGFERTRVAWLRRSREDAAGRGGGSGAPRPRAGEGASAAEERGARGRPRG